MKTLVTMAQHAYRIIKSVNPAAQVITPSAAAEGGPAWLDTYLAQGGGNYADIMSFHGYCNSEAESINSVVFQYRKVISAHGQGNKPLWDTEADWAGDPDDVLYEKHQPGGFHSQVLSAAMVEWGKPLRLVRVRWRQLGWVFEHSPPAGIPTLPRITRFNSGCKGHRCLPRASMIQAIPGPVLSLGPAGTRHSCSGTPAQP